jgi:hypothetical protein
MICRRAGLNRHGMLDWAGREIESTHCVRPAFAAVDVDWEQAEPASVAWEEISERWFGARAGIVVGSRRIAVAASESPHCTTPTPSAPPGGMSTWGDPIPTDVASEPVCRRELAVVAASVVLVDLTVWRGGGYAGLAVFFVLLSALLWLGTPRRTRSGGTLPVGLMTLIVAAKLVWCGGAGAIGIGFALIGALAVALVGLPPYIPNVCAVAAQAIPAGAIGICRYFEAMRQCEWKRWPTWAAWLAVAMPLVAVLLFGTIFVLANPDFVESASAVFTRFFRVLADWLQTWAPHGADVFVWLLTAWLVIGLLRPILRRSIGAAADESRGEPAGRAAPAMATAACPTPYYAAFRNTLAAVIVLFAVYLFFEFKRLWFVVFPEGFGYSGYAHQGAAWLTVALAAATVALSWIFRGPVFADPRLPRLRRLAWIWSAENLLLAAAVYHRLLIYIDFNGMTRMRVVGLLGITAVLAGFVVVVWKIVRRRGFFWLLQRHLWVLALAVFLGAVLPVDWLVHRYNVARIMAGDSAPCVQISVHPIDAGGLLTLFPLLDCPDEEVRMGVRAILTQRAAEAESRAGRRERDGWTTFQIADRRLLEAFRDRAEAWTEYADSAKRSAAIDRFDGYAYQWY